VFVPALGAGRSPGDGRAVRLQATDAAGEWTVRFEPADVVAEQGGAGEVDAVVSGPAGDLLLWLWGRRSLDDLEVAGARDAALALRAVTVF
jgi:hypothetical protein